MFVNAPNGELVAYQREAVGWALWRAPVIQLLGGRVAEAVVAGSSRLRLRMWIGCPRQARRRYGDHAGGLWSPGRLRRGAAGQGGNPAAKSSRVARWWDRTCEWRAQDGPDGVRRPPPLATGYVRQRVTHRRAVVFMPRHLQFGQSKLRNCIEVEVIASPSGQSMSTIPRRDFATAPGVTPNTSMCPSCQLVVTRDWWRGHSSQP
ncbi:hypothetical protein TSMEX_007717 [Taenia solium]|eukprot:TsM_001069300 transcript=TsM_001069300 gene=TsM_001069300